MELTVQDKCPNSRKSEFDSMLFLLKSKVWRPDQYVSGSNHVNWVTDSILVHVNCKCRIYLGVESTQFCSTFHIKLYLYATSYLLSLLLEFSQHFVRSLRMCLVVHTVEGYPLNYTSGQPAVIKSQHSQFFITE